MDELLSDQQQAEVVRSWFKENGLWLLGGIVLGLAGLFGWNQWQKYQEGRAGDASSIYATMLTAIREQRLDDAEKEMKRLAGEFARTPYADQGRLALARLYVDRNNPGEAVTYLQQVVAGSAAPEIRNIARLRMARLLSVQQKYDEALKLLEAPVSKAVAPAFHEVRGDVYFAMGKQAEARSEYEQALNGERTLVINRAIVQAKLDDLGGATMLPAAPGATGSGPDAVASPAP